MRISVKHSLLVLLSTGLLVTGLSAPAYADTRICTNVYRLQASNGYYVTAEVGRSSYDGMLRARTPGNALGTWEEFTVYQLRNTASGIISYSLKAHNGRYVDAYDSYTGSLHGMLRATATYDNNQDQRFYLPYDVIKTGEPRPMRSGSNGLYVANEQGYSGTSWGMLRARTPANALGSWEQFTWHYVRGC